MATAYTDTVLNYSGMLYSKVDNNTRLLDAIYTRGKSFGLDLTGTGRRKVNSIEFPLSSDYSVGDGEQPEITESGSTTAPAATQITRAQQKNAIQIFQQSVDVSYLKQSAVGTMAGLNIAGQQNNVPSEIDFQVAGKMTKLKKDLNYTYINGVYQESTGNTVAWKSRGLIAGITSNVSSIAALSVSSFNAAMTAAMKKGFTFDDGRMVLWCNPADLDKINEVFTAANGFGTPRSQTEGGYAITTIMTNYGTLTVDYDPMIPENTMLLLNMNELAVAELDVPAKGNFFYEALSKVGASIKGQLYGQAGIDYGYEAKHIKFVIGG